MGLAEVAEVLESNPNNWMTLKEITGAITTCGYQSTTHSLKRLMKRESYEMKVMPGHKGRYGSKVLYRYKEEK